MNVYLEGIKRFVVTRGATFNRTEEVFDKSQLKKLILPFDYNAPSRAVLK